MVFIVSNNGGRAKMKRGVIKRIIGTAVREP